MTYIYTYIHIYLSYLYDYNADASIRYLYSTTSLWIIASSPIADFSRRQPEGISSVSARFRAGKSWSILSSVEIDIARNSVHLYKEKSEGLSSFPRVIFRDIFLEIKKNPSDFIFTVAIIGYNVPLFSPSFSPFFSEVYNGDLVRKKNANRSLNTQTQREISIGRAIKGAAGKEIALCY